MGGGDKKKKQHISKWRSRFISTHIVSPFICQQLTSIDTDEATFWYVVQTAQPPSSKQRTHSTTLYWRFTVFFLCSGRLQFISILLSKTISSDLYGNTNLYEPNPFKQIIYVITTWKEMGECCCCECAYHFSVLKTCCEHAYRFSVLKTCRRQLSPFCATLFLQR